MPSDRYPDTDAHGSLNKSHILIFTILCLGIWLHAASSMIAATTLPRAVPDIGGIGLVGWAFSLYQLGSILAGACGGVFAARHGLQVSLLFGGVIYAAGCMLCGFAPRMEILLVGRVLQGLGGGVMMAIAYVALNRLFPQSAQSRLIAWASAIWILSAFCGPLVGGGFANIGLWRAAYWVFAGQAALFLGAVWILFPAAVKDNSHDRLRIPIGRLALISVAVLSLAMASTLTALPLMASVLCLLAIGLFVAFLKVDRASTGPMFPANAFVSSTTIGAGLIFVLCSSIATMSFLVYGPFLLIGLFDLSPMSAGYVVAVESITWGIAAVAVGGVNPKHEDRLIRLGAAILLIGVAGLAFAVPAGILGMVIVFAACQGAGFGLMWAFMVQRVVNAAPKTETDITASSIPATQQVGFAVGAAIAGIIANAIGFHEMADRDSLRVIAFWLFAAFIPLALIANLSARQLSR